jgi:acyl-homoserine lactone acylase PvdQ
MIRILAAVFVALPILWHPPSRGRALPVSWHPPSAGRAAAAQQVSSLDALARASLARIDGRLRAPGLRSDVQVVRDIWGIPHIYAQSTDDLFFAQGYVMAQDRLWQMEMWRRAAEGRLAEIAGPGAVARDRQTRLLKYRGPMDDTEVTSYHPEGRRIMTAFVNAYSLRAAADLPRFKGWTSEDPEVEQARAEIASWDGVYARESRAAAIYAAWMGASDLGGRGQPSDHEPSRERVEERLRSAIGTLTNAQGADRSQWRWGRMHTRPFRHAFVPAFDLPTIERAGGEGTVAADGATYREILDVSDWDRSLGANVPGQSGQPASPYYSNLLKDWADRKYFPLVFSKIAVDANAAHRLVLTPR